MKNSTLVLMMNSSNHEKVSIKPEKLEPLLTILYQIGTDWNKL